MRFFQHIKKLARIEAMSICRQQFVASFTPTNLSLPIRVEQHLLVMSRLLNTQLEHVFTNLKLRRPRHTHRLYDSRLSPHHSLIALFPLLYLLLILVSVRVTDSAPSTDHETLSDCSAVVCEIRQRSFSRHAHKLGEVFGQLRLDLYQICIRG